MINLLNSFHIHCFCTLNVGWKWHFICFVLFISVIMNFYPFLTNLTCDMGCKKFLKIKFKISKQERVKGRQHCLLAFMYLLLLYIIIFLLSRFVKLFVLLNELSIL